MDDATLIKFDLKNLNEDQLRRRVLAQFDLLIEDERERELLRDALDRAAYVHRNDRRSPGPYTEHIYRCTSRGMTYFDVRDFATVCSFILHDVVEDHPIDFAREAGLDPGKTLPEARTAALSFIRSQYGAEVECIVIGVTNELLPEDMPKPQKNSIYAEHVAEAIRELKIFMVKFSDFNDNGIGLHHTQDAEKAYKSATKYECMYPIYRNQLEIFRDNGEIDEDLFAILSSRLDAGEKTNKQILAIVN